MDFKTVTSRENPIIKLAASLQSSAKARRENGLFVLEGLRICLDAFENNIPFKKLIITQTSKEKYAAEVHTFFEKAEEVYIIPDSLFKKISDTSTPQGIIALAELPFKKDYEIDISGRYIALENIQDPSNLGAVSRTAEALGVTGIILSSDCCDPFSPKSIRASMGTLLRLPIIILHDFSTQISSLGLKTFGCVVEREAVSIIDAGLSRGCVLIIGNEANGITEATRNACDMLITIPMRGRAESLNAAVAASISMWEMMKE